MKRVKTSLITPIIVGFLSLYALTLQGPKDPKEVYLYEMGYALTQGRLSLSADRIDSEGNQAVVTSDEHGQLYLNVPLGRPLLVAPMVMLGRGLESILERPPPPSSRRITQATTPQARDRLLDLWESAPSVMLMGGLNLLAAACALWVLYLFVLQLGGSVLRGVMIVLTAGLCTALWPYAISLSLQPIVVLGQLGALYMITLYRERPHHTYAIRGGVSLALSMIAGVEHCLFGFIIAAWFTVEWTQHHRQTRDRKPSTAPRIHLIAFIAPLIIPIALHLLWSTYRASSILTPHSLELLSAQLPERSLWSAVCFHLLSPNQGLFIYSPILILSCAQLPDLWRKRRALTGVILTLSLFELTYYSLFGGELPNVWGPRSLMITTLPLLLSLSIAPNSTERVKYWIWGGLSALGFIIQCLAVSASMSEIELKGTHPLYFSPQEGSFWGSEISLRGAAFLRGESYLWWFSLDAGLYALPLWGALIWSVWRGFRRVRVLTFYIKSLSS